ncbi:7053_t:CDS:2 [Cetraspora pellucida]|uniref:7053_t:CDS:1 n=1 Tax=Cetraspora pellucida TaxID=1433469 RepID=A0ACA9KXC2_9GLOM|nr:7053_t:CDS:2 [Cetraspora pellucida]
MPIRNRLKQRRQNTEYKRQYRAQRRIHQRQKDAEYKRQYRARKKAELKNKHQEHKKSEITLWWNKLDSLNKTTIMPLTFLWDRRCDICSTTLLTGEMPEFCCNRGKRILPSLPPYPMEINDIINNCNVSTLSRKLNMLFSFTAIGVQGQFLNLPAPSSVCITGRTYHRILPGNAPNHSINWYLYDEQERYVAAHNYKVPSEWVSIVQQILIKVNPYTCSLRTLRDNSSATASLELRENTSNGEVAAIIHADNIINVQPRSILIWRDTDIAPKFVNILSAQYEPLQYPLLFPHGTPGWYPNNSHDFSQIDWYRCRLLHEQRFLTFGRLTSEYLVDMYSRVEEERLNYILNEKKRLNKEKLVQQRNNITIEDYEHDDDNESSLHLPASFLGSKKWCSTRVANALALARCRGNPSFFITMTTNPNWEEIRSQLCPGQNASELTLIVVRAFHSRLGKLKDILRSHFGEIAYIIDMIEFQKRGLPHAHIIMRVHPELLADQIDKIVSAELPRENVHLEELVKKYMLHRQQHSSRCLRNGNCIYRYPKPIVPETYIDERGFVQYRRRTLNDLWVVPYNPLLIMKLNCHINFEIASTVHLFMYLYKYIFKGPDCTKFTISNANNDVNQPNSQISVTTHNTFPTADGNYPPAQRQSVNEFKDYINGRYLSAPEAAWRIFRYHVTSTNPPVQALPIHLPNSNISQYSRLYNPSSSASLLDRYFLRLIEPLFDNLKYTEYYEQYIQYPFNQHMNENVFLEQEKNNVLRKIVRKRSTSKVTRVVLITPKAGELYYLRCILMHRAVRSWNDLKVVNGNTFSTYQEAARNMGLFAVENESMLAMKEAIDNFYTPAQLRFLFVQLILDGTLAVDLWQKYNTKLSKDFEEQFQNNQYLATNATLQQIALMLTEHGRRMRDFGLLEPQTWTPEVIAEHQRYSDNAKYRSLAEKSRSQMTVEQATLYDEVVFHVLYESENESASTTKFPMFLDGKAGRGKTFLINAICSAIRSAMKIVLPCGTTALAALLYEGGRTAHSLFRVPVEENNINIQSTIKYYSNRADLIRTSKLIIWDELPMANKAVIECVDLLLRQICEKDIPFGGKPFIGVGDFRQVAPVVKNAGKSSTIDASIKTSYLWKYFNLRTLNQPIRNASDPIFTEFIDNIGENWQEREITLDIFETTYDIEEAISFLYPVNSFSNFTALQKRAFLSPRNVLVDDFNYKILNILPENTYTYFSNDTIKENDDFLNDHLFATPDYLAHLTHPGIPNHELKLKVGAICSIMRNISIDKGLVKNTRVVITRLGQWLVEVAVLKNDNTNSASETYILSRINFYFQPDYCSWTVYRKQFPLRLAYATTFNSCQGLTLDRVVIDLRTHVFAHGQQYTALSRESIDSIVIWAIGTYPVEQDDNEIEMVMFVPIDPNDQDPDTHAVFEKNEYYAVSGKIVPEYYRGAKRPKMTVTSSTHVSINKLPNSNNCPLNVSLVGVAQTTPDEIKNDENAIIKTLINDYTTQEHNFIVNITYPYSNFRFKHFKNSIRPKESVLFIIGQLEIIQNELYIYAKDISYIDVQITSKNQVSDSTEFQVSTSLLKSTRSKLMTTHRNISEETNKNLEASTSINTSSLNNKDSDFQNSKRVKTDITYNEDEISQMDQNEDRMDNLTEKNSDRGKRNRSRGRNTRTTRKTRNSKIINIVSDNELNED